jgi:flagellar biosynthesis/type III secretory pathway chaperone
MLNQLADVLENQCRCYRQVLDVLRREKEAVAAFHYDTLMAAETEKESLVGRLTGLEHHRRDLLQRLAAAHGWSADGVSLEKLVSVSTGPERDRLEACRRRLRQMIERIISENQKNDAVFRQSLAVVRQSLSLLQQDLHPSPAYTCDGRLKSGNGGQVLSKEV